MSVVLAAALFPGDLALKGNLALKVKGASIASFARGERAEVGCHMCPLFPDDLLLLNTFLVTNSLKKESL